MSIENGPQWPEQAREVKAEGGEGRKMTPEELKSARMNDAELLRGGAEFDETGKLVVTQKQQENAREQMEGNIMYKDLRKYFTDHDLDDLYKATSRMMDQSQNPDEEKRFTAVLAKLRKALENTTQS